MRAKQLHTLLALAFTLLLGLGAQQASAQTPLLWGTSPFQDSMWSVDTTTWTVVNRIAPSLSGFTITGMTGLAYDPCGHQTYIIMKVSGVSGRVLGTINLETGVCTQVGNLGDNFSTINFREDGQLFGVTGDGGTVPETMYLIDKATGTKTLAAALGAGADGEVISYNWDDDFFYHWSGNGTVVYEKVMSVAPYTATNIPIIGTTSGETFGALYMGSNKFIISNISSSFNRCNTAGNWSASFGSNPDDLRGLILPPNFQLSGDTICVRDSLTWGAFPGVTPTDTVVYIWGDGDSTALSPIGGATHTYMSAGSFTSYVVLKNNCGRDTVDAADVVVHALPFVSLTPDPAYLCDSTDTLTLSGSSGGTSQWYMNGMAIVGANSPNYDATAPGWYNMTKTNLNGCTDSSAVGLNVMIAPATIDLLAPGDSTHFCPGDTVTLFATPGTTFYEWLLDGIAVDMTSSDTNDVNQAGVWTVRTFYGSCPVSSANSVTLIEDPLPVAGFSYTDNFDGTADFTDLSTDATTWAWDFDGLGTSNIANPTFDFGASGGTFVVTLVVTNSCGSDTLVDSLVIIATGRTDLAAQAGFSLSNQPNPFSDKTTFVATIPAAGAATLAVYNVHGQLVRTLHKGNLVAGTQRFDWDGRSDSGKPVAAGTYQAVLQTENGQVSRQVILAK
jgi:PKD repeat protein